MQTAFVPHTPGQGSIHFLFMQALFTGHSELTTHSGLHPGGVPMNSGKQEQIATPSLSLHTLSGPQGDGLQGFATSSSRDAIKSKKFWDIKKKFQHKKNLTNWKVR